MKHIFFRLTTFRQLPHMPLMGSEPGTVFYKPNTITTRSLTFVPIPRSRTMYKLDGEVFFKKIRGCGFPCDSNCATTKRMVCLGMGTEIYVSGKLCCQPMC